MSYISQALISLFGLGLRERSYITSSRQGGVGGPDTNDDIDDALRGGGGLTIKMMMKYMNGSCKNCLET